MLSIVEVLWLFLAHFLYDFHWQGDFVGKYKGKSIFVLLIHAFTWGGLLSFVLYLFGDFSWGVFIWLTLTHAVIDYGKASLLTGVEQEDKYLLYVDQILHAFTMIVVLL